MDVLEAIRTRRSIRKYEERPIPEEIIQKILDAGRWAPSSDNSQPWGFILIKDQKLRKEIADAASWADFLPNAPLGIAVVVDPAMASHPVEDGAAATQNMILAAHALGLGTCWIGSYESGYQEKVKKMLGVPKDKILLSMVAIGFSVASPKSYRKELKDVVFVDRYGKK